MPDSEDYPSFLISTFLESLTSLSSQKGSFYGATMVMRLKESVDREGLRKKATEEVISHIYVENGIGYIGDKPKMLHNYHDQLLSVLSALVSLSQDHTHDDIMQLLLPGVYMFSEKLQKDTQKTVGAEILIPFYISRLREKRLLSSDVTLDRLERAYSKLRDEKIRSQSNTILFSIEGLEDHPNFTEFLRKAKKYAFQFDNIEILAFLANYDMPEAYEKLYNYYVEKKTFQMNAFAYGEIFEIAWQFHLLLHSDLLSKTELDDTAKAVVPYLFDAGFSITEGVGISKAFALKDGDTTGMAYKLLSLTGRKIPLSIFSPYIQTYKKRTFFGSYKNEIRPSFGTMADILSALSFADPNDPLFFKYITIIHENLNECIRNQIHDIDKWHISKIYFYANSLIAYVAIYNTLSCSANASSPLAKSIKSLREKIYRSLIEKVSNSSLTCEERAWGIIGLWYYMRKAKIGNCDRKRIIGIITEQGKILEDIFVNAYNQDITMLEKMWIVKVSYSPLNIVRTLLLTSLSIYKKVMV